MAYVAGVSSSQEPAAISTFTMSNPAGVQVGDLLVAMCSRDGTSTTTTSNWTIPSGGEVQLSSIRMAAAYHRVTALPAPLCTFTGSSEEWAGCVFIVRDYNYVSADSDFIDVVTTSSDSAGPPYTCPAVDVNYANSLILTAVGVDGSVNPAPLGGNFVIEDAQDTSANSFLAGWRVEPTDGSSDPIDFAGTLTNNVLVFLQFAIRTSPTGRVPAYQDVAMHSLVDTAYHRERANAYVNETNTNNFRGWDVRDPSYVFLDDGGVFTNLTTAATNDTDADVAFPSAEAINDAFYIGSSTPFGSLIVDRAGCTAGAAGVLAIEYWNGTTWDTVKKRLDLTSNLTATVGDNQVIQWRIMPNWTTNTVNSQSAYWVRLRITTVYSTNPTVSRIRIAEAGLVYDAYGAVGDTGVSPFWSSHAVSPANTLIGCHTGMIRDLGTTLDLNVAENYLIGTYSFTAPREYYDTGAADLGYGIRFPLLDSSNNYRSWVVGGFAYPGCSGDKRSIFAVQPSQTTDTSHSVSGTAPNFDNTRKWVVSVGSYADEVVSHYWSYLAFANKAIIYGGSSAGPANWSDVQRAINGTLFPYLNGGKLYIPVKFGGSKPCHVDVNLATMDFVTVAGSALGGTIHVDPGVLGVIIDASDGDTIKLRNSTITSESLIRFEVDAGSSASATYDFSGLTVVNAAVTLRAVGAFEGTTFINCPTFTQNGATLSDCSFTGTKVSCATLDDMALISNSAFTSGGSGHAIEVGGTADTISLVNVSFNGYASSSGSTGNEAIYVNIASGTVTINISGGDTPSIRTAGATVNVVSGATVTFTGLPTGCDIVILTAGTSTILQQVDQHSGTSYGWGYSGTPTVDVGFIKPGYVPYYIRGLALGTSDSSIPVSLTLDRSYT